MMVYKCCTVNCLPNCTGGESKTVFSFSKREYLKTGRTKFFYRKVRESISFSYICIRYFEEKYYKEVKNSNCYGLAMNMKPALGIFDLKPVFLGDHRGNVYIKKLSMNFVSPQGLS